MRINAEGMHFKTLNEQIRSSEDKELMIDNCNGQRYIGSGLGEKELIINGTPGNALGAYLDGCKIIVHGNAQDATGDTMNDGSIVIHGSSGDATGYGMRGGKIFVRGDIGYRAGIHMKEYQDKVPILVIGGTSGSFLGEYQAGGTIIVLGLKTAGKNPVNFFCGTGMHGGRIFLRCEELPADLPPQVIAAEASAQDLLSIKNHLEEFCQLFDYDIKEVYARPFYKLTPNSSSPYKQLYTAM